MRLRTGRSLVLGLISLALAPLVSARQVVVTSSTPFRTKANKTSPSQAQLAVGTKGEVVGESSGWLQLKLDDGRTGYVYETHLKDAPDAASTTSTTLAATDQPAPPAADATAPPPAGQAPATDDLKAEIATLRAKIDSMNEALKAQHDAHPDDEHSGDLASRDGVVSWATAALLVGLFVGWVASRLLQRRSDRRQWNKLRF